MSEWSKDQDQPAMTLAAIRWYAMTIERMSTEIYITNPSNYPQVKNALDAAVSALQKIRVDIVTASLGGGGCSSGYQDCDGVCLPKCPPPSV